MKINEQSIMKSSFFHSHISHFNKSQSLVFVFLAKNFSPFGLNPLQKLAFGLSSTDELIRDVDNA